MSWIKNIVNQFKNWFTKKEDILTERQTYIETASVETIAIKEVELLNEIVLTSNNQDIVINKINEFVLDTNWTLVNNDNQNANFLSQVIGATAITGTAMYAANGLYKATVSPESLLVYKSGTLSSITMNGKNFSSHAGFIPANAVVFTPILVFQFASMLTGQYYFNGINKQLTTIQQGINELLQNFHNERIAKIRAITLQFQEYEKNTFFEVEDFVNIDKLKTELATIRYEYLLSANQELNETLFPQKTKDSNRANFVYYSDTSTAEELKIFALKQADKLSENIRSLYQNSAVESKMKKIGSFFENSGKKADELVEKLNSSKFMFRVEAALEADKLYQYAQFIELKANLSYKNPDENRIGKIKQLHKSLINFDQEKDSIFNDVSKSMNKVKTEFNNLLSYYKDKSFLNETEIAYKEKTVHRQFKNIDRFSTSNKELTSQRNKIQKAFETPIEFVLDNRNGSEKVYVKNN